MNIKHFRGSVTKPVLVLGNGPSVAHYPPEFYKQFYTISVNAIEEYCPVDILLISEPATCPSGATRQHIRDVKFNSPSITFVRQRPHNMGLGNVGFTIETKFIPNEEENILYFHGTALTTCFHLGCYIGNGTIYVIGADGHVTPSHFWGHRTGTDLPNKYYIWHKNAYDTITGNGWKMYNCSTISKYDFIPYKDLNEVINA